MCVLKIISVLMLRVKKRNEHCLFNHGIFIWIFASTVDQKTETTVDPVQQRDCLGAPAMSRTETHSLPWSSGTVWVRHLSLSLSLSLDYSVKIFEINLAGRYAVCYFITSRYFWQHWLVELFKCVVKEVGSWALQFHCAGCHNLTLNGSIPIPLMQTYCTYLTKLNPGSKKCASSNFNRVL
jgi:hypothetical protein